MGAEEVADVRGPGDQRERIPHGNMCAKLLNYIGQIFECKADSLNIELRIAPFMQVSLVSLEQGLCTCGRNIMRNASYAPAFLDIAYPIT